MRSYLTSSFILLALVVGAAGVAPAAHAQTCPDGYNFDANDGCQPISTGAGKCAYGYEYVDEATGCVPAETAAGTGVQDRAAANTVKDPNLGKDTAQFGVIMTWIMNLFAWLAGIAAMTLDYAVYYTVITMGDYIHNLSAIGVTWRILRDIGNIMLIFGFLSVGLTTILNVNWYGFTTKMLPMLLVSAVFLNFSLFMTEAVIDTGNLFATQFMTQINGGVMPTRASLSELTGSNEGISNKIMAQLGFQTIYNVNTKKEVLTAGNTWLVGFLGIILFVITAFVMFSLAFILIARFVILLFLIIVAPVGFAGLAVPKMKNLADKWWSELFEQTITAPVLLLSLYVALAVITDTQFLTGLCTPAIPGGVCTKDWLGFVDGSNYAGFVSLILSFLVAMGLLLGVVIFSKKLSAFGGGWATKTAGKVTFGATAFGLRSTAGLGSQTAARLIKNSSWGASKTGRVLAGTFDRGAKASYDIRGATAFGGLKGGMGIDAGDAQKGGYRARQEKSIKAHEEYAKSLSAPAQTQAQKEAIAAANAKHEAALKEVAELETRKKSGYYWGPDSGNEEKLVAVRQNAAAAATIAQQTTTQMTPSKESRQKKYAESIQGNFFGSSFPGWVMFGSGGAQAAKNIIKGKKNTVDLDEMKKYLEGKQKEEAEKNASGGGETKPVESPKPDAAHTP